MARMKRLQISLEPELDRELGRVASAEGISKAEIVRRCLRNRLGTPASPVEDPFVALIGAFSGPGGNAAETHDDVIYDRRT